MTLCNLTVEAGARGALIAPDDKALEWVKKHAAGLSDEDFSAMAAYAKELRSDPGASFDTEIELNADDTAPMVTWGTSPEQSVAIDEVIPDPNAFTDEMFSSEAAPTAEFLISAPQPPSSKAGKSTRRFVHR